MISGWSEPTGSKTEQAYNISMNNDRDIALVVAAALRYALGRSSYIVPTVQDFLRRHLDNEFIKQDKLLAFYVFYTLSFLNSG